MVDFRMLNGHPKATAIVRLDHTAMLIIKGKKKEFRNIKELKKFKESKKIETNIEHIHPASIRSEQTREWNIPFPREISLRQHFKEMVGFVSTIFTKKEA
jgi:hypothetical protein